MVDANCPSWEYADHPDSDRLLPQKSKTILLNLRNDVSDAINSIKNTRRIHQYLFCDLTPDNYAHYAGNYRGSNLDCLRYCRVFISSDNRVGVEPDLVCHSMNYLSSQIDSLVVALGHANALPDVQLPKTQKIIYLIAAVCRIFVEFLRVHPYVNGNGHMGRFIVITLLGKFGYWPKNFPLNERPPDPPYSDLIKLYRDGHPDPLEQFVLKCMLGTA